MFKVKMAILKVKFNYYDWKVDRCLAVMWKYSKTDKGNKWKKAYTKNLLYGDKRTAIIDRKRQLIKERFGL